MSRPFVDVAAGLIMRPDGWLLLAERPDDKPWSGWWELPGGKIEPGETVLQALSRELQEELDIVVTAATPWVTYTHDYAEKRVRLAFCRVTQWQGTPVGAEGQKLLWVDPHKPISTGRLLPATEPPLRWLRIPDRYLLTSIGSLAGMPDFLDKLTQALENGLGLVQFREPVWAQNAGDQEVYNGFMQVLQRCHQFGAKCLINSGHPTPWRQAADGVQIRAADAPAFAAEPSAINHSNQTGITGRLTGLSAHSAAELALADQVGADFAVLGHVLDTPSHTGQPAMGWARFAELARNAGRPVFAIGGQSADTLTAARRHGAHGIAGIRHV